MWGRMSNKLWRSSGDLLVNRPGNTENTAIIYCTCGVACSGEKMSGEYASAMRMDRDGESCIGTPTAFACMLDWAAGRRRCPKEDH